MNMKEKFKHNENTRKLWREAQRRFRAPKRGLDSPIRIGKDELDYIFETQDGEEETWVLKNVFKRGT